MKKIFATLLAVFMLTASLAAATLQDKKMSPLQQMLSQLNLSGEQKTKLEPIAADQAKAQKTLRENTALSDDDRKAKNRELSQGLNAKLKEILTSEQFEKLKELRKANAQKQSPAGEPKKP